MDLESRDFPWKSRCGADTVSENQNLEEPFTLMIYILTDLRKRPGKQENNLRNFLKWMIFSANWPMTLCYVKISLSH